MKRVLFLAAAAAAAASLWTTAARAEVPRVVATIKPIHSLVAAVMGDLGAPELIVRGGASPHTYSLRPSDAHALEAADIVFWTGHGLELFLEDALDSLAAGAVVVELAESPGIALLPIREGGAFDAHSHEAEDDHRHEEHEDGHDHAEEHHDDHDEAQDHAAEMDMHFWLDPANAALMVREVAATLGEVDPANAAAYRANADAEVARLEALTDEIEAQLAPVRATPFVVFHDAYQYFERRFGLSIAGSITVTPDTMPGAARVAEIRDRIGSLGAACVFAEPQFEPAIVQTIIEGTHARAGTLDPEAAGLAEGPELYGELLRGLAAALVDCLAGQ